MGRIAPRPRILQIRKAVINDHLQWVTGNSRHIVPTGRFRELLSALPAQSGQWIRESAGRRAAIRN